MIASLSRLATKNLFVTCDALYLRKIIGSQNYLGNVLVLPRRMHVVRPDCWRYVKPPVTTFAMPEPDRESKRTVATGYQQQPEIKLARRSHGTGESGLQ